MPRKKLSRTKSEKIEFALYPEEKAAFDKWCETQGVTMSDVLRSKIEREITDGEALLG